MTCKGDTYKAWGFEGCKRKAMVKRFEREERERRKAHRKKWAEAKPLFPGVPEMANVRKHPDGTLVLEPR